MKRAQAAMEFLMTYGWAILVVLVVIGALASMGIMNPQKIIPNKCNTPVGMACEDYVVTTNAEDNGTILLVLTNSRGEGITFTYINATSDELNTNCEWIGPEKVRNGKRFMFNITNSSTAKCKIPSSYSGEIGKYAWGLDIKWYSTSKEYTHTASGEILASIE